MILYFSATGNTRFVATSLARRLGGECVDLGRRMHEGDTSPLVSERPFVLCFPVYVDGMPMPVYRHVRDTPLLGSTDAYVVTTTASTGGISGRHARGLFRSKGMTLRGWDSVVMPRNYLVGPFPDEDPGVVEAKILAAPAKVAQLADAIAAGRRFEERRIPAVEYLLVLPFLLAWDRVGFPTRKFAANDRCVGCGMCERLCPMSAIRMERGVPVWQKRQCMHCMACIQNCPEAAIEYGKALEKRRRYRFGLYADLVREGVGGGETPGR